MVYKSSGDVFCLPFFNFFFVVAAQQIYVFIRIIQLCEQKLKAHKISLAETICEIENLQYLTIKQISNQC